MIRRPPRSTQSRSSAASDVYKRQVLGISHFSKNTAGREPVERVTGSVAFGALARIVLVAAKGAEGEPRLLARAKSNIGPDGGGFAYKLKPVEFSGIETCAIEWG